MTKRRSSNQSFAFEQETRQHNSRSRKSQFQESANEQEFTHSQRKRTVELVPKSRNQEEYIDLLTDPDKSIVFATGVAGTGKSMMAVLAAIKHFQSGAVKKIIIARPAVGVDEEEHGFLPGSLAEKLAPWCTPLLDVFSEYFTQREINKMLEEKTLEMIPLAMIRGRTFKNAFVILDEMQNSSINMMKTALTRLGDGGSKMVITGDLGQRDRQYTKDNGLQDFIQRLEHHESPLIGHVHFDKKDVQRSKAVSEVLRLYGDD